MKSIRFCIVALAFSFTGCKTLDVKSAIPAVISNPSAATHAELSGLISQALGGVKVVIAPDVLTKHSILAIQNKEQLIDGNPVMGRIEQVPHQFELVLYKNDCFLINKSDGSYQQLKTIECREFNS